MQDQDAFADVMEAVQPHYVGIRRIFEARVREEAQTLAVEQVQSQLAEAVSKLRSGESTLAQNKQVFELAKQGSFSEQFVQEAQAKYHGAQKQHRINQQQHSAAAAHLHRVQKDLAVFQQRLADCLQVVPLVSANLEVL